MILIIGHHLSVHGIGHILSSSKKKEIYGKKEVI